MSMVRVIKKIRVILSLTFIGIGWCPFTYAQLPVKALSKYDKIDLLDFNNIEIFDAFKFLSLRSGVNISVNETVKGRLSIYLTEITVFEALDIIVGVLNLAYVDEDRVIKIMTAAEFENKYGYPFGKTIRTKIIQLTHTDTNHVTGLLNQLKSPGGTIIADQFSRTIILKDESHIVQEMEELVEKMDVSLDTKIFQLNHAKTEDIAEKIKGLLTDGAGIVIKDDETNSLIVSARAGSLNKIEGLINAFDKKQTEVFIEAKIIQVVLNDEHKLGIEWEALVNGYHGLNIKENLDVIQVADKFGRMGIGVLSTDGYSIIIESLESIGETNILSNPRIIAVNKQEAKILVGSTEPYVTSTTTTPSAGPATTAESVNFIEVGVKLFATPIIHDDGFITMKIKPEVSSVTRNVVTANNNTIPVVETSQAETTVIIKDNSTIMIGGLIKDESIGMKKQIPVLGQLPVLGGFFRNEEQMKRKTEIVIFLTPRIISGENTDFASFSDLSEIE